MLDEKDHRAQLDILETMTGMPHGTLQLQSEGLNRSLTYPEAEMLRSFSKAIIERKWSPALHLAFIRRGVKNGSKLVPPAKGEPRVALPPDTVTEVLNFANEQVAAVEQSPIDVVGDIDTLTVEPDDVPTIDLSAYNETVPVDTFVAAMAFVIESGRSGIGARLVAPADAAKLRDRAIERHNFRVTSAPTRHVLGALLSRTLNTFLPQRAVRKLLGPVLSKTVQKLEQRPPRVVPVPEWDRKRFVGALVPLLRGVAEDRSWDDEVWDRFVVGGVLDELGIPAESPKAQREGESASLVAPRDDPAPRAPISVTTQLFVKTAGQVNPEQFDQLAADQDCARARIATKHLWREAKRRVRRKFGH